MEVTKYDVHGSPRKFNAEEGPAGDKWDDEGDEESNDGDVGGDGDGVGSISSLRYRQT